MTVMPVKHQLPSVKPVMGFFNCPTGHETILAEVAIQAGAYHLKPFPPALEPRIGHWWLRVEFETRHAAQRQRIDDAILGAKVALRIVKHPGGKEP